VCTVRLLNARVKEEGLVLVDGTVNALEDDRIDGDDETCLTVVNALDQVSVLSKLSWRTPRLPSTGNMVSLHARRHAVKDTLDHPAADATHDC
jgi:hypothetical protein